MTSLLFSLILTFLFLLCNVLSKIKIKACSVTIDVTPLIYKKSKKSDKILIEHNFLSKGLLAMNTISHNMRYYPHDLNTKFLPLNFIKVAILFLLFVGDIKSLNLPFLDGLKSLMALRNL